MTNATVTTPSGQPLGISHKPVIFHMDSLILTIR